MRSTKIWIACRRRLHHRNQQHQHVGARLMSIGYECAAYVDRDLDLTLLERSLRSGTCKMVIEKSKAADAVRTYDLLTDLAASEDVDLQQFYVLHTLSSCITRDEEYTDKKKSMEQEVSTVQDALRSKTINAITMPISSAMLTTDNTNGGWMKRNFDLVAGSLKQDGEGTVLGLDLSTEWLATASDEEIARLLTSVDAFQSSTGSTGGGRLTTMGLFSVATNAFTHHRAARIFQWARSAGVQTVATEVLRCHSRRPGMLSVSGGRHKLTHLDPTSQALMTSAQQGGYTVNVSSPTSTPPPSPSPSPEYTTLSHEQVAVETMKNALNACVHAEKQFLERFQKEAGIDPQALCWGHILSHTQHTILFPEEWDYFHANQINPRLTEALDALKSKSRAMNDWAMLYGPLAKHLFASFTLALETRRTSLCHEVYDAIERNHPSSSSSSNSSSSSSSRGSSSSSNSSSSSRNSSSSGDGSSTQSRSSTPTQYQQFKALPWVLTSAAGALGSDHVALSSTELLPDKMLTNTTATTTAPTAATTASGMNSTQATAIFDDVRKLLVAFQDEQSS